MTEIVAAVIGGFLAAGTGYLFERRREAAKLKRSKELLVVAIADDLRNAIGLYDKLMEDFDKTKIVWLSTTNELKESRQIYQNNRDWITLFDDHDLRKRVFQYYHKSSAHINQLSYREERKLELQQRLQDLVKYLQLNDQTLSSEEARNRALELMSDESNQYQSLLDGAPKDVAKLRDYRAEAQRLLDDLN